MVVGQERGARANDRQRSRRRVPPYLSFTRLLLICHLSLSQKQNEIRVGALPNQDEGIQAFSPSLSGRSPGGIMQRILLQRILQEEMELFLQTFVRPLQTPRPQPTKNATTSPHSNPRNHIPTPVRSRIRNSILEGYPSSKKTSLVTGLEYSFRIHSSISSLSLTSTLPQDTLRDAKEKVGFLPNKKQATLEQLQSLLGALNFACRAISPG